MKKHAELQTRLRHLLMQELDRRLELAQQRLPRRCVHNYQQPLDTRRQVDGEPNEGYNRLERRHLPVVPAIGLCTLGTDDPQGWNGTICEDDIDAQQCPDFVALQTKEQVIEEFKVQIRDFDWVQENLPRVDELSWALEEDPARYEFPWWKRFLLRFKRFRLKPVLKRDVLKLLPPGGLQ